MKNTKIKIILSFIFFLSFIDILNAEEITKIQKSLYQERNNYGLIVIGNSSCHYCKLQKEALDYFKYKYSWIIQEYDNSKNPSVARAFNVQVTPSIFLISKKNKQIIPVAEGYLPIKHLEVDVFKKIHEAKGEQNVSVY